MTGFVGTPADSADAATRRAARLVAWTTAIGGALFGFVGAGWQSIIESAQVLAGVVPYRAQDIEYHYLIKIPVLQDHIAALLMWLGADEVLVCRIASGVTTALMFQAWGLFVFGLSRSAPMGVGAPFLVMASLAGLRGLDYAINFPPIDYGYGPLTLIMLGLVAAYLAVGWERAAGFTAGLMPATHPIVGVWGVGVVCVLLALEFWRTRRISGRFAVWFAVGLALAVIDVGGHVLIYYRGIPVLDNTSRDFVFAFSHLHDDHRARFGPSLTLFSIVVSAAATVAYGVFEWRRLDPGQRRALGLLALNALFGAMATSVYWWPQRLIPLALFSAMPNRFLNVNALMFAPLMLGSLIALAGRQRARWLAAGLVALLGLDAVFVGGGLLVRGTISTLALNAAALTLMGFLASPRIAAFIDRLPRQKLASPIVALGLAAGVAVVAFEAYDLWRSSDERFVYYANDAALAAARQGKGDLLFFKDPWHNVGAQTWTRRPLVIDPNIISAIPYMGEEGALMLPILHDVYGIDLLSEDASCNEYSSPCVAQLWQARTAEDWTKLAAQYRFDEILVPERIALNLPLVADSGRFRLYRVTGAS